jgi:hypothetical protein
MTTWQRPTLPYSEPYSTIGDEGLDFRVRDGNGYFPLSKTTRIPFCGEWFSWQSKMKKILQEIEIIRLEFLIFFDLCSKLKSREKSKKKFAKDKLTAIPLNLVLQMDSTKK